MKKKKKLVLLITALAVIGIVPLAVGATIVLEVPSKWVNPAAEYYARGEQPIDDYIKETIYGRLDCFDPETEADAKDEADRERIRQKNELLAEYRALADEVCGVESMKIEEFEAKEDALWDLFMQASEFELPPTPEEVLERELSSFIDVGKQKIFNDQNLIREYELGIEIGDYEGDIDQWPAKKELILQGIAEKEKLLAEAKALESDYNSGKLSYEETKSLFDEYDKQWNYWECLVYNPSMLSENG